MASKSNGLLRLIGDMRITTVRRLAAAGGRSSSDLMKELKSLEEDGKVELNLSCPPAWTFREYLSSHDHSFWLYALVGTAAVALVSMFLLPSPYLPGWASILRWVLASIFVLYLPGFSVTEALFPKRSQLSSVERLALGIGLSMAIAPITGFVLDYSPWGIQIGPVTASLGGISLGLGLVAAYRKYLSAKEYGRMLDARFGKAAVSTS